jgi:hypothetical protein
LKPKRELTHRDSDRDIVVGKWLSEEDGDEWTISFEPIPPIPLRIPRYELGLEGRLFTKYVFL